MYPVIRFIGEMILSRRQPPLDVLGTHISHHRCYPWDLDPWIELNNGRTLTLYDLGRLPLAGRTGLIKALKDNSWSVTVAGNSVRYRRRIRVFQRFTMLSRVIGWDARFIYMEQSMWKSGECLNHMLVRTAVTSAQGIVPTDKVLAELGADIPQPELPAWVRNWIDADASRPWPPVLPPDLPPEFTAQT